MVISKYLSSAPQRYPKTGKHIQANKTSLQKSGNITSKTIPAILYQITDSFPRLNMKSKWLQILPALPFDSDAYTTLTFLSSSTTASKKKKKKRKLTDHSDRKL